MNGPVLDELRAAAQRGDLGPVRRELRKSRGELRRRLEQGETREQTKHLREFIQHVARMLPVRK